MKQFLSTLNLPATTTLPDKPTTEKETPDNYETSTQQSPGNVSIGNSPPQSVIIAVVLGVIVIVGVLVSIGILSTILHRRIRKQPRVSTNPSLNLQNASLILGKQTSYAFMQHCFYLLL